MRAMVKALQQTSVKDTAMKCDVMFLWGDDARPSVIKEIPVEPEIDEVEYVGMST